MRCKAVFLFFVLQQFPTIVKTNNFNTMKNIQQVANKTQNVAKQDLCAYAPEEPAKIAGMPQICVNSIRHKLVVVLFRSLNRVVEVLAALHHGKDANEHPAKGEQPANSSYRKGREVN